MAKRVVRVLVTAALAWTAVGASGGAASAERWWGRDAADDVRQYSFAPEPPPCGTVTETTASQDTTTDIVGLSVRHEGPTVELRAHVADLTIRGDRQMTFDIETDRRAFEVAIIRWSGRERYEASLLEAAEQPESVDECGSYATVQLQVCSDLALTWSSEKDFVAVVVPRSCLRDPRWVKAGVRNFRMVRDRARYDAWAPRGADPLAFSGPFGPRVRHSR